MRFPLERMDVNVQAHHRKCSLEVMEQREREKGKTRADQ